MILESLLLSYIHIVVAKSRFDNKPDYAEIFSDKTTKMESWKKAIERKCIGTINQVSIWSIHSGMISIGGG